MTGMHIRMPPGLRAASLALMVAAVSIRGALGSQGDPPDDKMRTVTITAEVPPQVGTVYLTGNQPELGSWNPHVFAMSGAGPKRTAVLHLPLGTQLEYKFTLGSWNREALGPSGAVPPNYHLSVDRDEQVSILIPDFKKGITALLDDWKGSGVLGRLEYWTNFPSKFLVADRNIEIWLPPGYDDNPTNRYNVLYMQDGQNLFDPRLSYTGIDWGVDKAIVRGMKAGTLPPLIVVGIWNTEQRLREYSPWNLGTNYARFLMDELMPQVNEKFRTFTGPQHTAVMGSSMGGLISFWLCWKHPDVFGSAACLSTAFTWTGHRDSDGQVPLIEHEIASAAKVPRGIRLYFDYGTGGFDADCEPEQNSVNAWLISQGLKQGEDFVVHRIPGAEHNEAAWRARLDLPLNFLFGPTPQPQIHKP